MPFIQFRKEKRNFPSLCQVSANLIQLLLTIILLLITSVCRWICCPQSSCGKAKVKKISLRKCSHQSKRRNCRSIYFCSYNCNISYYCYQPKKYYFLHKTREKIFFRSEVYKSCSFGVTSIGSCPKKKLIHSCLSSMSKRFWMH